MVANSFQTSKKFFNGNRGNFEKKQEKPRRKKVKKSAIKQVIFSKCTTAAEIEAMMRFITGLRGFLF